LALTAVNKNIKLEKSVIPHIFTETKRRPELITKMVVGSSTIVTDLGLPSRRTAFQIVEVLVNNHPDLLDISEVVAALGSGSKSDEEVEIQTFCHKLAAKVAVLYPDVFLKGITAFDLSPVFIKVLPNTAIEVDIKANEDLVNSAKQVVVVVESGLFSHKYLSEKDTLVLLEPFVKAFFGGFKAGPFYNEIISDLSHPSSQEIAIKALTEFFKLFDTKLQNNIAHKPIAEDIISGLDELLAASTFKQITTIKDDPFVKSVLQLIKILEVAFTKLEKQKADMKVVSHPGFIQYLNNTIKKGPLSSKYAEIKL